MMTHLITAWWLIFSWPGNSAPRYAPHLMPARSYQACERLGRRLAPVFRPVTWQCDPPLPPPAIGDGQ